MTEHNQLVKQIATLMENIANGSVAVPKALTHEEQMRAGYEKVKAVNPDMTFEQFRVEMAKEEREKCGYFQRVPEALAKGIFFDEDFFGRDAKLALEIASMSKFVLIPSKAWADVIGNEVFASMFDPITRYDLAVQGRLGTLLGCAYYTDAFANPENKDTSACAGKVVFVMHDHYRPFFNDETKQFDLDGAHALTAARNAEEDRAELERCPFVQLLPAALERGVLSHVDIFNGKHQKQLERLLESSAYALIPNRAWSHIIGSNEFASMVDQNTEYTAVLDGDLGALNGCRLYTDGFLKPHLKDRSEEAQTRVIFVPRETE